MPWFPHFHFEVCTGVHWKQNREPNVHSIGTQVGLREVETGLTVESVHSCQQPVPASCLKSSHIFTRQTGLGVGSVLLSLCAQSLSSDHMCHFQIHLRFQTFWSDELLTSLLARTIGPGLSPANSIMSESGNHFQGVPSV